MHRLQEGLERGVLAQGLDGSHEAGVHQGVAVDPAGALEVAPDPAQGEDRHFLESRLGEAPEDVSHGLSDGIAQARGGLGGPGQVIPQDRGQDPGLVQLPLLGNPDGLGLLQELLIHFHDAIFRHNQHHRNYIHLHRDAHSLT